MKQMTLDERKKVSLEILKDIDMFCNKENIPYFLAYGTLLGAIRHNGFIPWDDDIDIWIKAEDYWRFASIMKKSNYDVLFYPYNNGWDLQFIKISNSDTIIKDGDTWTKRGVAIDVFPVIENYSKVILKLTNVAGWYRKIPELQGKRKLFTRLIPEKFVYFLLKKVLCRKCSSDLMYSIFSPYKLEKDTYRREWFDTSYHDLEGYKFRIPSNYDAILTQLYGDYMTPPNEKDRNLGHNVEAYWKGR